VWRFKEGFGAQFTPHVGAYDFAGIQPVYWLYSVAMPKVLEQMRRNYLRRTQP
jgi:lipid II:glycine glycyltransferase (peptidoglycan interpeptide bridge formation enzyme)